MAMKYTSGTPQESEQTLLEASETALTEAVGRKELNPLCIWLYVKSACTGLCLYVLCMYSWANCPTSANCNKSSS